MQVRNMKKPISIGDVLIKISQNTYTFSNESSRRYWTMTICEAASELEDLQGLSAIFQTPELSVAHTAVRKAFRIIDFINYGPTIE